MQWSNDGKKKVVPRTDILQIAVTYLIPSCSGGIKFLAVKPSTDILPIAVTDFTPKCSGGIRVLAVVP